MQPTSRRNHAKSAKCNQQTELRDTVLASTGAVASALSNFDLGMGGWRQNVVKPQSSRSGALLCSAPATLILSLDAALVMQGWLDTKIHIIGCQDSASSIVSLLG